MMQATMLAVISGLYNNLEFIEGVMIMCDELVTMLLKHFKVITDSYFGSMKKE
jgi:hypothetical protein